MNVMSYENSSSRSILHRQIRLQHNKMMEGNNQKISEILIVLYSSPGVSNAKLEANTRYSFFQRTFINDTSYFSHKWMEAIRTKPSSAKDADESLNDTEIAIITVGVAIGIIVIIFFIVVCCHWKYSRNYAPKPKKKQRNDHVQRQMTGL